MATYKHNKGPLKITEEAYERRNKKMRKDNPGMASRKTKGTHPDRVKFACRFGAQNHPMKDDKGEPTPYAMALKKWGFGSAGAAKEFCRKHKKKDSPMQKKVSWKYGDNTYSGELIPSMETKTHRFARTHNNKIKKLPK
jgi:hypothetical protein